MDSPLIQQFGKFARQRTAPLMLELDLTEGVLETRPPDPVSALMTRHQATITDILAGLRLARTDARVKALIVKVGGRPIGLGLVQELRAAVKQFGAAGKPTIAWADTFGEFSPGNVPYYLATAFDQIWLQPSGDLMLNGMAVERRFLRGALDKLGVTVQVGARHEYKSAAEQLTETGFSGPAREATDRVIASVSEQVADAIATRAQVSHDEARRLIDQGPYTAEQAKAASLVDNLGYRDEVYTAVRKQVKEAADTEPELLYLGRYHRQRELVNRARQLAGLTSTGPGHRQGTVALITATGGIRRGRSGRSPLTGTAVGSDSLTAALRAATRDPHVKAIVLRVNSPGGSYIASDAIWREVVRTRNAGKPIVVSMSDIAGSGGYYISMAADTIFAQPGTITGSIGVVTAKPALGTALGKAGVTTDSVVRGEHADMFSLSRPFSDDEWTLVNDWLDRIYADFTGKVAAARGMSAQRVHELAKGRIWTGADAQENGLVDELGGLEDATTAARRRAGLADDAPLVLFPRLGPLDRLRPMASSEDRRAAAEVGAARMLTSSLLTSSLLAPSLLAPSLLAEHWGPVWRIAAQLGLPSGGPLLLPGEWTFL